MLEKANLQPHPASLIFPEMDAETFSELRADIKKNGLLEPVVLYEGMILDGRNREKACRELGIPVKTTTWDGDDPIAYVVSHNLIRRHLTASQRAMCAARARKMYDDKARERMLAGKKAADPPKNSSEGRGDARDQAGKAFKVSGFSVDAARKVLSNGVPELVEEVDRGERSVSDAAKVASKPKDKQRAEMSKPKPVNTEAQVLIEKMDWITSVVSGILHYHGGVKALMESDDWATSSKREKRVVTSITIDAAAAMADLAKQMKAYRKEQGWK